MKRLEVIDLGLRPYGEAWEIQKELFAKRVDRSIPDTLLLVEHPHVYTLGKHANADHLLASQEYLQSRGIELYHVDRGGDITYHGPGQLVGYPIFHLKDHGESVGGYVHAVETVLIRMLHGFGIEASRQEKLTGVWVGDRKIAALGMRVSKWVTMHGFALNVTTDLSLYDGIVPCGLVSKGVTRMADLCPDCQCKEVVGRVIEEFVSVFDFDHMSRKVW